MKMVECVLCGAIALSDFDYEVEHACSHGRPCARDGCLDCVAARAAKTTKQEKQVKVKDDCAPVYVDETPTTSICVMTHLGCVKHGEKEDVKKSDTCSVCSAARLSALEAEVAALKKMLASEERAAVALATRLDREDRQGNLRTGVAEVMHALARRIERDDG